MVAADASSELAKAIVAGGFGLVSPYDDLAGLQRNLEAYADDAGLSARTEARGLEVVQAFDRKTLLGDWESSIERLVARGEQ